MTLNRTTPDGLPINFIQGNEACVFGALHAGCNFFAGYPITPSTEIAEGMARDLPLVGGTFIQMEDEIASIGAVIGASAAGAVSMSATSGPGFSLMQENLGYAYVTQIPMVLINVQRGGPSTGSPTSLAQADTMQARWGTHGDYTAIVIAPSSVQESYNITIRAFQLAERFSTPVIVLLDELVGHMREKVILKETKNVNPVKRTFPEVPPEWYFPYKETLDMVSHPAPFGEGYRYNITGLIVLKTIWPFPDLPLKQIAEKSKIKIAFVAENNMGQLIHPVKEALPQNIKVMGINRYDGHSLDPYKIVQIVKEEIYA